MLESKTSHSVSKQTYFELTNVQLTSGDIVDFSKNLTVIVGPNNVGKSKLLSSVWDTISRQSPAGLMIISPLVSSVAAHVSTPDQVVEAMRNLKRQNVSMQVGQSYQAEPTFVLANNNVVTESVVREAARARDAAGPMLGPLASQLCLYLTPESRLGQLGQTEAPNMYGQEPSQPVQKLFASRALEETLRTYAKRAFGLEITVNRHAGGQTGVHVGRPASPEPRIGDRGDYLRELAVLPLVNTQGHGVQAFLGIVAQLLTTSYDVVMVDEPEAFLHPPQARLLGEIFVELSKQGLQVVVSTHSDDFLKGVLSKSAATSAVTVVRLTRPTLTSNKVAQVQPGAVRALYEDPLLRYSSILSGIFYRGIVICEAEADSTYYSAVVDAVTTEGSARSDLLFTQTGGKDRFAKGAAAVVAANVPTAVIADIDLLADPTKFAELLSILGGDAAALTPQLNTLTSWVNTQTRSVDRAYAQTKIAEVFAKGSGANLNAAEIAAIRSLIKQQSGWSLVKAKGRGGVAKGDVTRSFDTICEAAKSVGLFLVPVGELEGFHPEIGGTKQEWLRQVLESRLFEKDSPSHTFVKDVMTFIAARQ